MSVFLGVSVVTCVRCVSVVMCVAGMCGLHVVSSTFVVLERRLHRLFQVKKGRARHVLWASQICTTRCCRSYEPIQMSVSPSHGSPGGTTKVPTEGVASWIAEHACTESRSTTVVVSTSAEGCLL